MIREKLCTTVVPDDAKEIEILEVDELFTYYQKKAKKPIYTSIRDKEVGKG
jgi:hypothetical protein